MEDKKQELIETLIANFLTTYPWFERRLANMDADHRNAVGILLENHPHLIAHLKVIFDVNLDADGFDLVKPGHWVVTREQYTLMGFLSLMEDGDEMHLTNYKKGSGIIGLDGTEMDSVTNQ